MLSQEAEGPSGRYQGAVFGEFALSLYGAAGVVAAPAAGLLLRWRQRRGKEDGSRRGERFGISVRSRPQGPLIWVHAASVGETVAALPLIERLQTRGLALLLTTGTVTAAQIADDRLSKSVIHQFAPVDMPFAIRRFLDHWRPSLAIFVESELWPTILNALGRRSLPLAVVNARMSERSFRTWRSFPPLARAVLGRAELVLAQSLTDAERFRDLGARRVTVCGNLKFDAPPPPADENEVAAIRASLGARPVWVAASTHPGEDDAVLAAHRNVARKGVPLLTVVAPRHPKRGDAIAEMVHASGLSLARRSAGDPIAEDTEVCLADTIGEMGLWYRIADAALLGGSMVPHGGQNPIEPAKLRVPILHGGHVSNFRDLYKALEDAKAVCSVSDAASLAATLTSLIDNASERERLAREAYACVERFTGALERTMEALEPLIEPLLRSHHTATGS